MWEFFRGSHSQRRTEFIRRELLQYKDSKDRNILGAGPRLPGMGEAKLPKRRRCKEFRQCGLARDTVPSFPELLRGI
jgi:hypothetical protein